jgi:hypothetical protein
MFFPEIRVGWAARLFPLSLQTLMPEGEGTAVKRRRLADEPLRAPAHRTHAGWQGDALGSSAGVFHTWYTNLLQVLIPARIKISGPERSALRRMVFLADVATAHHIAIDPGSGPSGESHAGALAMSDHMRHPAPARIEETHS